MLCLMINVMEGSSLSQQYAFILPVGIVIVFAVLVFAFGFKSPVEPPNFKYISSATDDKKNTKKKRIKDKKPQSNGHATIPNDVVEGKKADSTKSKQSNKVETPKAKKQVDVEKVQEKKVDVVKSPPKKDKKAGKKIVDEKPLDYDEGEWEVIPPARKDKKIKKKDDADVVINIGDKKKKFGTKKDDKLTILEAEPIEILNIEDILPKSKEVAELIAVSAAPVVEPITVAAAPEPVADDQAAKKKKAKKAKVSVNEDEAAAPVPAAQPAVAPAVAKDVSAAAETTSEQLMAFNELEDAWKEAPQKKSKKKVRKD